MRQTAQRAAGVGVALTVAGSVIAGCTSNGDPVATPTSPHVGTAPGSMTTAPTSSPMSSGPTANPTWNPAWPAIPAKAKKHTPWGARAFTEFYMKALNYAWARPDPGILVALSKSTCKSCSKSIELARELQINHQRYAGDAEIVIAAEPIKGKSALIQDVDLTWKSGVRKVVDAHGKVVRRPGKDYGTVLFRLNWTSMGWFVQEIYREGLR